MFQLNDFVQSADLKKMLSKTDTTNWSYKLYKITELINGTKPKDKINNKENKDILKPFMKKN